MTTTLPSEQIDRIVWNQHHNPFEVLGPHPLEQNGKTVWVVRAYLPKAEAAWVVRPEEQLEDPMQAVYHPHFFECVLNTSRLTNYQLRIQEKEQERVIYDPYAFCSPHMTDFDIHLFAEGNHHRIYEKLGAHLARINGVDGVYFAVWAPDAQGVAILGDFNRWEGQEHPMRLGRNGIWEMFVPGLGVGDRYKYQIRSQTGQVYEKSDPYGFQHEVRPRTASIVADLSTYTWTDQDWMGKRRHSNPLNQPISVYEVHLGSWLHASTDEPARLPTGETEPVVPVSEYKPGARFLTYRELAARLIPYVKELGYTHLELLPIAEHPFDGSWGYQVTGYYACTSRYGSPQDLMYFIDQCHQNGLGVIMDWVPGHFPKDGHGLACFDGTHLYEHADPRRGEHKEWGTLIFNFGRHEVRNFLVANALFWLDKYHIDGIRVDAVSAMLYLDYYRKAGTWLPNEQGGRENLEAIEFLRQVNRVIFSCFPGILSIAEESSTWPLVSWPTDVGGLGFNLKWNLGWIRDVLDYFSMDPWFRQYHQNNVTFGMWYQYSENFVLVLSHDDVTHGQGHLIGKMPGDTWQQFANLRCLLSFMFTHPGKKTVFMGMEFAQWNEWNAWADLEWQLLQQEPHQGIKQFFADLNQLYCREPALYTQDFEQAGFEWIDCNDHRHSVVSFIRRAKATEDFIVVVCNFTPQPHSHYRVGVPEAGFYAELFNSDARPYGGSNMGNLGGKWTQEWFFHARPYSLDLCLPPLATLVLKRDRSKTEAAFRRTLASMEEQMDAQSAERGSD